MYINLSWFVRGFSQMVVYKMSGFEKKNVRIPPRLPRWDSNAKRPRGRLQLRYIKNKHLLIRRAFIQTKCAQTHTYRQTDLKICQYLHLPIKIICWRFHINYTFLLFQRGACEIICAKFDYKHSGTNRIH